jgi:hypothetical protein
VAQGSRLEDENIKSHHRLKELQMSATTITITTAPTSTAGAPKRSFKRRYTVAQGNAIQGVGMLGGSALLAVSATSTAQVCCAPG